MSGRPRIERLRGVAFVLVGVALVAAIWSQRATALRWSIARDAAVPTSTFASALVDPGAALLAVRDTLRSVARRPTGLLARTVVAQSCSAVILLVALRGLGVGSELATLEFLRVYFVVTLLSSFAPTPGGVGVVEAGLTGALVAAGVAAPTALAAVLVYRLLTYVTPIVVGASLYAVWRLGVRSRSAGGLGASPVPARSVS